MVHSGVDAIATGAIAAGVHEAGGRPTDRQAAGSGPDHGWLVGIDVGGTFTDGVAIGPAGEMVVAKVRIGLHASDATQVGGDFHGKGVHEAARIAALGGGGDIVASVATVGEAHRTSNARSATLKGLSGPMEIVDVDWR